MALTYSPKVGEVLECEFGEFGECLSLPPNPVYNGLIRPEIRKRRMVVVLNGRLPNGCVLVVPISSSGNNTNSVQRGIHVPLDQELFQVTNFYDQRDRWALAECVTHVSKMRLSKIKDCGAPINTHLPRDVVTMIQEAIIKTISASTLLAKDPAPGTAKA